MSPCHFYRICRRCRLINFSCADSRTPSLGRRGTQLFNCPARSGCGLDPIHVEALRSKLRRFLDAVERDDAGLLHVSLPNRKPEIDALSRPHTERMVLVPLGLRAIEADIESGIRKLILQPAWYWHVVVEKH